MDTDKKKLHRRAGRGGPGCRCCSNHFLNKLHRRAVRRTAKIELRAGLRPR